MQLPFLQRVLGEFSIVPFVVGRASPGRDRRRPRRAVGRPRDAHRGQQRPQPLPRPRDRDDARPADRGRDRRRPRRRPDDRRGVRRLPGARAAHRRATGAASPRRSSTSATPATPPGPAIASSATDRSPSPPHELRRRSDLPMTSAHFTVEQRRTLLDVATASIRDVLAARQHEPLDVAAHDAALQAPGATFVTLERDGALLGCIGTLEPVRPLVADVAHNATSGRVRRSPAPAGDGRRLRGDVDRDLGARPARAHRSVRTLPASPRRCARVSTASSSTRPARGPRSCRPSGAISETMPTRSSPRSGARRACARARGHGGRGARATPPTSSSTRVRGRLSAAEAPPHARGGTGVESG